MEEETLGRFLKGELRDLVLSLPSNLGHHVPRLLKAEISKGVEVGNERISKNSSSLKA